MQLHTIKKNYHHRVGRRIGRGGKRGTYSGRGTKGQHARSGAKIRPAVRDIIKRIPKLRGYKFKSFRPHPAVVNLADIDKKFKEGSAISPETLVKAGLVRRVKGRIPPIKVLGRGELKKRLEFKNVQFSRPALEKLK